MKRVFLEKFFPASRTASIRKEICGIRQHPGKTLYEYWERFKKLCATYPHHQISEQLLIQYFYEGLSMMDRSMIDATSGGALMDKTPATASDLQYGKQYITRKYVAYVLLWSTPLMCAPHTRNRVGPTRERWSKYGKQPYQSRPFDNQQYERQPSRPGPNQGPYAAQQFGSTPNAYQRQAGYQ
ncbi:hypothetical protein CR513_10075, partial [Mucuna pruriens]